jgi:hypothetical protein
MPFPCRFKARFTYTMPFPCRDRATAFVSHWPSASEIGMFLVTTFLALRVVTARSRTLAGGQNATCRLWTDDAIVWFTQCHSVPTLFACRHPVATMPRTCRERHRNGMVCVNQTRPHCVNQVGKTQSKPLAERHGMCESAFNRMGQGILPSNFRGHTTHYNGEWSYKPNDHVSCVTLYQLFKQP